MNAFERITRAGSILKHQGLRALLSALLRYFSFRKPGPNESMIAFKVLDSVDTKGTMIDVGAHVGGSLAPFARTGWRVLAFEPDSDNRIKLSESFRDLDNVIIDSRGLSDSAQEGVTLYRSEESTGISGLSAFHPSHVPGEVIDVTTLEQVCRENELSHIDFLKIDTEGFDLLVLKGVPWDVLKPRVILCEFEDSKTLPLGYTFYELAEFLRNLGYTLVVSEWYPIERYGGPHKWRCFHTYPCELHDSNGWGNIIAVSEESLYQTLLDECKGFTQSRVV